MKTSEILKGDLLFLSGKGIIKSIIEEITNSRYYHCAIFIDKENVVEAQGGRKSGTTPLSYYLNSGDKLVVFRDVTLTDEERERIINYANSQSGLEYDYFGILAELARYELNISLDDYNEGKRRICSTFVNDCAKSVGRNWSNVHIPSPADLLNSGKLKRIGQLE